MQTTDPKLLFQTTTDLHSNDQRQKKAAALAKRGHPIIVPGKILDTCVWRNEVIVGESGGSIRRIDIQSGTVRRVYKGHDGPVSSVATIDTDNSGAASTTLVSGSWDKTIRLWNLDTGETICVLRGHSDFIKHLLPLPQPLNLLISTSSDKVVRVWDLVPLTAGEEPRCVQILRNHTRPVLCSVARQDNHWSIWTGDSLGVAMEWKVEDRRLSAARAVVCHETSITGMRLDEDGLWTSSIDKTAQFRTWTSFDKPTTFHHPAYVTCILPLPSSMAQDTVLTGSDDGLIRAWSFEDGEARLLATAEGHDGQVATLNLVSGTPGLVLSGGLDRTVRRWKLQDLLNPPPLLLDRETENAMMTEEEERELEELMS